MMFKRLLALALVAACALQGMNAGGSKKPFSPLLGGAATPARRQAASPLASPKKVSSPATPAPVAAASPRAPTVEEMAAAAQRALSPLKAGATADEAGSVTSSARQSPARQRGFHSTADIVTRAAARVTAARTPTPPRAATPPAAAVSGAQEPASHDSASGEASAADVKASAGNEPASDPVVESGTQAPLAQDATEPLPDPNWMNDFWTTFNDGVTPLPKKLDQSSGASDSSTKQPAQPEPSLFSLVKQNPAISGALAGSALGVGFLVNAAIEYRQQQSVARSEKTGFMKFLREKLTEKLSPRDVETYLKLIAVALPLAGASWSAYNHFSK